MDKKYWIIIAVTAVVIIIIAFYLYNKKKKQKSLLNKEIITVPKKDSTQEETTRAAIQDIINRNPNVTIKQLNDEWFKTEIYKKYQVVKFPQVYTMLYNPFRAIIDDSTGKLIIKSIG